MKIFTFILSLFLLTYSLQAQISQGGKPLSFTENIDVLRQDIQTFDVASPNKEQLIMEDIMNENKGGKYRIGVIIPSDISPENSGTWDTLSNGYRIWRILFHSQGAQALNLYFDNFKLPAGVKLYAYSADKQQLIGAFTEFNNHESLQFATQSIYGETIILELNIPQFIINSVQLHISGIGYNYRGMDFLNINEERDCMINVNCPEGSNWQNQKRGVAKIQLVVGGETYLCTGSLVNNTNNNCVPYFLTAFHCGDGATAANLNQWVFYFNYEAAACSGGEAGPQNQSMTGASLIANSTESWPPNGSDFYLIKLNNTVPTSYNPYYNGWSRATTGSPSGVGIHHPGGRNKKISTYTSTLTNYGGTHWSVIWAQTQTNWSVTAGGSSGSPIFNNNGLIVGTLTGGGSYCETPSDEDVYGKFSYHWESNGTADNRKLKPWLDPAGTNPNTLTGISYTQCGTSPYLEVSPASLTIGSASGSNASFAVSSNVSWTVTDNQTWLSVAPTSGSNSGNVTVTASSANTATSSRTAVVTVTGSGITKTVTVIQNGQQTQQQCDTISNVGSEDLFLYSWANNGGYVSGHNTYSITEFAEKFTGVTLPLVKGIWILPGKAVAGNSSSKITVTVLQTGTTPGSQLATKDVLINTLSTGEWNYIPWTTALNTTGNYFIGYQIYTTSGDQFAMAMSDKDAVTTNTAYLKYNGSWVTLESLSESTLKSHFAIYVHVCPLSMDISKENSDSHISVFPNPADDRINIGLPEVYYPHLTVRVFDLLGKTVYASDFNEVYHQVSFNSTELLRGIYIVQVKTPEFTYTDRLIINR